MREVLRRDRFACPKNSIAHAKWGSTAAIELYSNLPRISQAASGVKSMIDYLKENANWIFSGVGATFLTAIVYLVRAGRSRSEGSKGEVNSITINNNNNSSINNNENMRDGVKDNGMSSRSGCNPKSAISILFIDDDIKFQVVNILKNNGWINTKIIKDVKSLEQVEVASADIFFVDIQGVGVALGFKDQGLGLVIALRRKYPQKKIVIYSAENADAFHAGFKDADDRISKDADPYEFIEAVDRFSI